MSTANLRKNSLDAYRRRELAFGPEHKALIVKNKEFTASFNAADQHGNLPVLGIVTESSGSYFLSRDGDRVRRKN